MLDQFSKSQQLINQNGNILIISGEEVNGDSLGSMLALYHALKKSNGAEKNFHICLPDNIPSRLQFLINAGEMEKSAPSARTTIISINNELDNIAALHYEKQNNALKIILSLNKDRAIRHDDIKIETSSLNYDLAIVLDTSNLINLGKIYEKYSKIFSRIPIINIDCHKNNWRFGNANLVNQNASSTAEITKEFINFLNIPCDKTIATCLLCGIIEKTQSFRKPQTPPRIFRLASELIDQGADKELIIKRLYKTKPINTVRLWGEIMKNLKYDRHKKFVSCLIPKIVFQKTETNPSFLKQLADDLGENFSACENFLILWESRDKTYGIFTTKYANRLNKTEKLIKNTAHSASCAIKNDYLILQVPEQNIYRAESLIFNLINRCV
ncbi:MAG: hypothetical protein US76_04505 [Parcubacteria group bacterium GW2011_GWA2_38_13b]|nr:MAG: hypothetical protein US76_04505 [Parcubacteria group bacterium GW2011_GWA2_38_13b]